MRIHKISLDLATDHTPWLADGFGVNGGIAFSKQVATTIRKIIAEDLTPTQRELVQEYYYSGKTVTEIAKLRGTNKSSVSRGLKAARTRIERAMKYGALRSFYTD